VVLKGYNMEKIYLDYASGMSVDSRVFDFAKSYLMEKFGNPSSLYNDGVEAKSALEEAREKIAKFINAEDAKTIIFTGSATEANNLAIRGTALRNIQTGKEVLSSSIEHKWF
jgi:cysteine desulfurase